MGFRFDSSDFVKASMDPSAGRRLSPQRGDLQLGDVGRVADHARQPKS